MQTWYTDFRRFLQNLNFPLLYHHLESVFQPTEVASPLQANSRSWVPNLLRQSAKKRMISLVPRFVMSKTRLLNQIFRDVYIRKLYHLWPAIFFWMNCNISTSCVCRFGSNPHVKPPCDVRSCEVAMKITQNYRSVDFHDSLCGST